MMALLRLAELGAPRQELLWETGQTGPVQVHLQQGHYLQIGDTVWVIEARVEVGASSLDDLLEDIIDVECCRIVE